MSLWGGANLPIPLMFFFPPQISCHLFSDVFYDVEDLFINFQISRVMVHYEDSSEL